MTIPIHPVTVATLALACLTAACVPTYKPPTANEPHSILKLRRTYEKTPGTQLTEIVSVGDDVAYQATSDVRTGATPQSDAILIHPVPIGIVFKTAFSHKYMHMVMEHYSEQVPYQTTETYNCGTPPHYQMCTRPVTQYRFEQKSRWVNRTDTVIDGACESTVRLNPKQGSSYLMQYTYQDHNVCSLSCFEQVQAADGTLNQVPCGQ